MQLDDLLPVLNCVRFNALYLILNLVRCIITITNKFWKTNLKKLLFVRHLHGWKLNYYVPQRAQFLDSNRDLAAVIMPLVCPQANIVQSSRQRGDSITDVWSKVVATESNNYSVMIRYSLKWRCCTLVWPKSLWKKAGLDHPSVTESSLWLPPQNVAWPKQATVHLPPHNRRLERHGGGGGDLQWNTAKGSYGGENGKMEIPKKKGRGESNGKIDT